MDLETITILKVLIAAGFAYLSYRKIAHISTKPSL